MAATTMIFAYFLIFAFGAVAGSFLNVVILRYNTGRSFLTGSSRCFSCGEKLVWFELVPILSFVIQKGRCRKCKSKISWQYPIVEFVTGALFTLAVLKVFSFGYSGLFEFCNLNFMIWAQIIFLWVIFSFLVIIAIYDIRHQIIPNSFVWLFTLLVISYWLLVIGVDKISYPLSGLCFAGFFALLWLVSRGRWIGFGDAKLALGLGWFLGPHAAAAAFLLTFWIGTAVSIFLLLFKGKKFTMKSRIPFAPFLVLGSLFAYFLADKVFGLFFTFYV